MKFKTLMVLLLAGVWSASSWWWYACRIKGFCGTETHQTEAPAAAPQATADNQLSANNVTDTAAETSSIEPSQSGQTPTEPSKASSEQKPALTDTHDSDKDGLPDEFERKLGLDPYVADSDKDGLNDQAELGNNPDIPMDTDNDGVINALDNDDDGDNDLTANENADPDGDGLPTDARDTDADGLPDYLDKDTGWTTQDDDGDGISNGDEKDIGTNPALRDTDGDGVQDDIELTDLQDTDDDGLIDALDTDDDGDGIMTAMENPDPNGDGNVEDASDTDGDGLPDYLDADASGETLTQSNLKDEPDTPDTDMARTVTGTTPDAAKIDVPLTETTGSDEASTGMDREAVILEIDKMDPTVIDNPDMADETPSPDEADLAQEDDTSGPSTLPPEADKETPEVLSTGVAADKPEDKPEETKVTTDKSEDKPEETKVAADKPEDKPEETDTTAKASETAEKPGAADQDDAKTKTDKANKKTSDDNKLTLETDESKDKKGGIRAAKLHFPYDSAEPELADSTSDYFDEVIAYLKAHPDQKILLTGHTDSVGRQAANQELGLERAKEIRDLLVQRGAPRRQIDVASKGEDEPLVSNRTEAGRKKNRRVELAPVE